MSERESLYELAADAWRALGSAASLSSRVKSAIPIMFFGDLSAYLSSKTRVLTVGLNPSWHEFPTGCALKRFPLAEGLTKCERDRYLDALSAYFRTCPYRTWFSGFDLMLRGMGASYYEGQTSTALHTDICSPIATEPTWRRLDPELQKTLEKEGRPIWHELLRALRPQIVSLSIASCHLTRIDFQAITEWNTVHVFKRKKDGSRRKQPVKVCARWYEIGGDPVLFIFVRAAQTPLGLLSNVQKEETGAIALEVWCRG